MHGYSGRKVEAARVEAKKVEAKKVEAKKVEAKIAAAQAEIVKDVHVLLQEWYREALEARNMMSLRKNRKSAYKK